MRRQRMLEGWKNLHGFGLMSLNPCLRFQCLIPAFLTLEENYFSEIDLAKKQQQKSRKGMMGWKKRRRIPKSTMRVLMRIEPQHQLQRLLLPSHQLKNDYFLNSDSQILGFYEFAKFGRLRHFIRSVCEYRCSIRPRRK